MSELWLVQSAALVHRPDISIYLIYKTCSRIFWQSMLVSQVIRQDRRERHPSSSAGSLVRLQAHAQETPFGIGVPDSVGKMTSVSLKCCKGQRSGVQSEAGRSEAAEGLQAPPTICAPIPQTKRPKMRRRCGPPCTWQCRHRPKNQ
jgi:hypothetical protein